jgi:hypothetical protein
MTPPLTDRDYAEVRQAVMQRIERRKWTVRALQVSFAIVAIAVAGIALWPRKQTAPIAGAPPQVAVTQQPSTPVTQQPQTTTARPRNQATRATHVTRKRNHHKRAVPKPEPLRIELATADPDVRIIWITNPNESR